MSLLYRATCCNRRCGRRWTVKRFGVKVDDMQPKFNCPDCGGRISLEKRRDRRGER